MSDSVKYVWGYNKLNFFQSDHPFLNVYFYFRAEYINFIFNNLIYILIK